MKTLGLAVAAFGLSTGVARADDTTKPVSKADEKFMESTARAGMAEVQISKLAVDKAKSDKAKTFAQHMVDDHTKANEELTQLAGQKNVTLPTEIDAEHQKELDKLTKLTGTDFDKEYLKAMRGDHEKVVASFKKASKTAGDADLKQWVKKTLPTLEAHLDMVEKS
jgi:putative membrane protein